MVRNLTLWTNQATALAGTAVQVPLPSMPPPSACPCYPCRPCLPHLRLALHQRVDIQPQRLAIALQRRGHPLLALRCRLL